MQIDRANERTKGTADDLLDAIIAAFPAAGDFVVVPAGAFQQFCAAADRAGVKFTLDGYYFKIAE